MNDPDLETHYENERLEHRVLELEVLLKRASRGLTTITRQPNVEWVADEHNKCVRLIRDAVTKERS